MAFMAVLKFPKLFFMNYEITSIMATLGSGSLSGESLLLDLIRAAKGEGSFSATSWNTISMSFGGKTGKTFLNSFLIARRILP